MKLLIYILPLFVTAQTWVFDSDYKIPANLTVEVDSIIGNGYTLFLQCNSKLIVNHHIERVNLYTMRSVYERCNTTNTVYVHKAVTAVKVRVGECVNVEKFSHQPTQKTKKFKP